MTRPPDVTPMGLTVIPPVRPRRNGSPDNFILIRQGLAGEQEPRLSEDQAAEIARRARRFPAAYLALLELQKVLDAHATMPTRAQWPTMPGGASLGAYVRAAIRGASGG